MSDGTLSAFLDSLAARRGDAPAFIYDDRAMTFRDLAADSRRVAAGLAELGVGAGDRVAIWLPNVPAWPVLFFACARLGAIAVAVNTRFRSTEVGDIVGRSGAKLLVLWPGFRGIDFLGILAAAGRAAMPDLETLVFYDEGEAPPPSLGWPVRRYADLRARPPLSAACDDAAAGALIFTTSGTTRAPKLVLHAQRSLAVHGEDVAAAFGYDAADAVLLQALPLCGTFGHAQMMGALAAGRPSVLLPAFDGDAAAAAIAAHRVTHFNGSDEMFRRLFDSGGAFGSLRACGFAAFNPSLGDVVAEGEGHGIALHGLYGMSEVQALFARRPPALPAAARGLAGGLPAAAAARVRVRDPDSGRELGDDANGELEIKGPSLMSGYFEDPDATDQAFSDDGFFRTGDLGATTADGGFVFLTRMGDVLRLGGYLVAPAEIEAHLAADPRVAECQVVGIDTAAGPRAAAFVIAAAGAEIDTAALQAHCARGLAKFKVPVAIYPIDAFPVTPSPNGEKIQRGKLRAMAQQRLAGSDLT